ncbi:MAG: hypothetical protein LBH90_09980 [Tannerella sp.]|jgi:hypothetical protein|nr:hypothetical protein [Tannerella sp.]
MRGKIFKYSVIVLLLAGCTTCKKEQMDVPLPPEAEIEPEPIAEPYAVAEIESLRTQLRIIDAGDLYHPEEKWNAALDSAKVIYAVTNRHRSGTYFGYADDGGKMLLCEVVNFPEAALAWEEKFVYPTPLGTVTEIDIQLSGTLRLYINDAGEKCGTLELTSLEPRELDASNADCNCDCPMLNFKVLNGVEAYFFKDSISPDQFRYFMLVDPDFACWIVFGSKTKETWIHFNKHNYIGSRGAGKICNFPDLTQEKDACIPENGSKVYIEGAMYDGCYADGGILGEGIMFNYVLTKFKIIDYEKNNN